MFGKICLWSHLPLDFVCREVLHFFLIQSWWAVYLWKVVLLFWALQSVGIQLFIVFSFSFVFLQCQLWFLLSFLILFGSSFFHLGDPGQRFVNFVYHFKKQLLILFLFFLISILSPSSLIFIIAFFFAEFRSYLFFFSPILLGDRLGCLVEIFLVF